jgi:glycosyltransferase involved in cell wall biosynthesis
MVVGRKSVQSQQIPNNIIAVPRTDSQFEPAEIYSHANAVISTSRQETFGLTLAEGMACGTPAIAYNTTALPELITPNTGIVVEQGDIDGLAQAIMTICNNGKEHYKDVCRQHALKHFDKTTCFEKYIKLYNEILNKK